MTRIRAGVAALLLFTACAVSGCAPEASGLPFVAVSFPGEADDHRWGAAADELRSRLEGEGMRVEARFAGDDVPTQVSQVDELLEARPEVLVIAPVDATSLTNRLERADQLAVPVIAFDRMVDQADAVDWYATFDERLAGRQQGWALLEGLGLTGDAGEPIAEPTAGPFTVELLAGSGDDVVAEARFAGAVEVLAPYLAAGTLVVPSGRTDFAQAAILRWDGEVAAARVVELAERGIVLDGVLSPDDRMSRAVIDALTPYLPAPEEPGGESTGTPTASPTPTPAPTPSADLESEPTEPRYPVITGGGASLASVRAVLDGTQSATVLQDSRVLARAVATMIERLLRGDPAETTEGADTFNGARSVPTRLVDPVAVDADNVSRTVLSSGYWTEAELAG